MRDQDFERLYAEHAAGLFSYLAYRTGDRGLAEDVVSETFERAYRARTRFDPRKSKEKTWLYAIATNLLRDSARRSQAETRALEQTVMVGGPDTISPHEQVDERERLMRALDGLSAEEREAIALRFGGDLTLKEIAGVTGEAMTTVEGRVYRALRKLRTELE